MVPGPLVIASPAIRLPPGPPIRVETLVEQAVGRVR